MKLCFYTLDKKIGLWSKKEGKKIPDLCLEPVLNFNIRDGPKSEAFDLVSEETDIGVQRGHGG